MHAGGGGDPIRSVRLDLASLGTLSTSSRGNGPKDTRLSELCLLVFLSVLFHGFAVAASTRFWVLGKRAGACPELFENMLIFMEDDRDDLKLCSSCLSAEKRMENFLPHLKAMGYTLRH